MAPSNTPAQWLRGDNDEAGFSRRQVVAATLIATLIVGAVLYVSRSGGAGLVPVAEHQPIERTEFLTWQRAFQEAGLSGARFEKGQVLVPADQRDKYRAVLPKNVLQATGTERWADVWKAANERLGQFSGSRERDAAREIARAEVISRLLAELPDIDTADVVWDEDTAKGWRREQKTRATVYLRAIQGKNITPEIAQSVRMAVAGSKGNLSPQDVIVFDQGTMTAFGGNEQQGDSITRSAQYGRHIQQQIESSLDYIQGVRVDVHVATSSGQRVNSDQQVSVAVSIPEEYIRDIAGIEPVDETEDADSREQRHGLYRRVESQITQTVKHKVARLIPGGTDDNGDRLVAVDTIPMPLAATRKSKPATPTTMAALVSPGVLQVLAILCALGAVGLLLPGRKQSDDYSSHDLAPSWNAPATGSNPAPFIPPIQSQSTQAPLSFNPLTTAQATAHRESAATSHSACPTNTTQPSTVNIPLQTPTFTTPPTQQATQSRSEGESLARLALRGRTQHAEDAQSNDESSADIEFSSARQQPAELSHSQRRPAPSLYQAKPQPSQQTSLDDQHATFNPPPAEMEYEQSSESPAVTSQSPRLLDRVLTQLDQQGPTPTVLSGRAQTVTSQPQMERQNHATVEEATVPPVSTDSNEHQHSSELDSHRRSSQSLHTDTVSNPNSTSNETTAQAGSTTGSLAYRHVDGMEQLLSEPAEIVREVANRISAEVWATALFGTSIKLQQRILPELAPRIAQHVQATLANSKPLRLREIDRAQQEILDAWSEIVGTHH